MALFAIAFPVLSGKTEQWKAFTSDLKSKYLQDFKDTHKALAVHERTFLQQTPMGDLVIVTLEGENPAEAFAKFGQGSGEFNKWFVAQVKEIHGVDLTQPPTGPMPELIVDSEA